MRTRAIDVVASMRTLLTALVILGGAVLFARSSAAHPMIPRGLSVAEVHRLLSEARWSDEPKWTLDLWLAMEGALAQYRHDRAARLDSIAALLEAEYPSQYWFNWPALKDVRAVELRDAAVTTSIALERELFESLRNAASRSLQPGNPEGAGRPEASADLMAWIEVIDRAERRRRRTAIVPLPSLSRARIADVEWLVRAEVPDALREPRVRAILDEWSRDLDGRIEGLWHRLRETEERYRAALGRQGIDPGADIEDRDRWLPEVFPIWLEVSAGLRQDVAASIAAARRAVEQIETIVGSEVAIPLLDEWIGQAYAIPINRFVGLAPEGHEAVVDEWRRLELDSRSESIRRIESSSPARWPLERGRWNHRADEVARRPGLARLAELDAERTEAAGRLTRSLGPAERSPVVRQEPVNRRVRWSRAEPLRTVRHLGSIDLASTVPGGRSSRTDSDESIGLPEFSREELQSLGAALFVDSTDRTIWAAMVEDHLTAVAAVNARLGARGVTPRGFLRRPRIEPRVVTQRFETESSRSHALSALETRLFEEAALLLDGDQAELVEAIGSWRRIDHALHACRHFQRLDYGAVVDARGFANALGAVLAPFLGQTESPESSGPGNPAGPGAFDRETDHADRAAMLTILRDALPRLEAVVEERARIVRRRVVEHFIEHAHPESPDPDHIGHQKALAQWWREEMALRDEMIAVQEALVTSVDAAIPGARVAARWRRAAWPEAHGDDAEVHGRIVKAWTDAAIEAAAIRAPDHAGDAPPGASRADRARDLEHLLAWFEAQWSVPTEALVAMSRGVPPRGIFTEVAGAEQVAAWHAGLEALHAARLVAAESAEVRLMILLGVNPIPSPGEPKRVW